MTRSLYFAGGLLAMALIVFASGIDLSPARRQGVAAAPRSVASAPAAADPVAEAIDDLAAWPTAARH